MKKYLIILLACTVPNLFGQTESVRIEWETNHDSLSFPHALYEDGQNTLPYYTRIIPWDREGMLPEVEVEVTDTLQVDPAALSGIMTSRAEKEPLLEYSLVREAGHSFLSLKILPFFRSEDGMMQKIGTMDLRIGQKTALARLKSQTAGEWKSHSVLASGDWYKVSVEASGIYSFSYQELLDMGIQNPASVRIYGTGGRQLPEAYSKGTWDDLDPVPVYFSTGTDGIFGPGDQVLFYAEGPVSWKYDPGDAMFVHELHTCSVRGYYFVTGSKGTGLSPETVTLSSSDPGFSVTGYDYRTFLEEETYNLISSGREWFGDVFEVNLTNNYPFQLPGHVQGDTLKIRIAVAARSGVTSFFNVRANNQYLGRVSINRTDLSLYTATYAYENDTVFHTIPQSDIVTVTLNYDRPDSNSEGWLNFVTLNARSPLEMGNADQLDFRDSRSAGMGHTIRYTVGSAAGSVIWDITDPSAPLNVPYTTSGNSAIFTVDADGIREYIAFDPQGKFPTPDHTSEGLGSVANQDLHGLDTPDMVILTPAEFLEQASRLADHRRNHDGLDVKVVAEDQVFNEFSSGTPDVTALRNFMKMFYDRSAGYGGEDACRYLLLFGDGSFANRDLDGQANNPNKILTYQSVNSLSPTQSYVSDDFYGLLDTDEDMYNGLLDVGIGRLPVSTEEEATHLVDKLIYYDDPENQGDWRNQICFIGDDEDNNIHMRQADELATYVNNHYPSYNINKIYLDAYQQVKTATGFQYPDVVRAINDQVNRGALIVNYTGHGGTNALAHEKVVTKNEISSWSNYKMLPLFMTATCEFSKFDDYSMGLDEEETSAGEEVLLSQKGGGIALFTTTRLVYSGPNHVLNEKFYEVVFEKDENMRNYRLGDIIAYSKNNTGAGVNKRNFTLLGDPSMRLAYPRQKVMTDSINSMDINVFQDTVSAFDWVTVAGHIETQEGELMENYDGEVYPIVFDKEKNVETLANDNGEVWNFRTRNSILYSGKVTVKAGRFRFGFYVPKDINYAYGPGKISYYSKNNETDANGFTESLEVGGIGTENVLDDQAPEVALFMNDSFFIPDGVTDPDPSLLVYASDNYGINTTGNGIGHDLTATLDGNRVDAIILNEFYQANTDSYNSGVIRYPYSKLEEGKHEITVKIWDIHNNSTEKTIGFRVVNSPEMLLEQLFNYPNPFREETLFSIEHNRPDQQMRVVIRIYDLSGNLARIIDREVYSGGYRIEPIRWDGTGTGGSRLGAGVYLYRVTLTTEEGESVTDSGKMIMVN